jgi:hypothetical protein
VSGKLNNPAALPPEEKRAPVPIGKEAGWVPRAGQGDVKKRKFFILPGLEFRPLCRPAPLSLNILKETCSGRYLMKPTRRYGSNGDSLSPLCVCK